MKEQDNKLVIKRIILVVCAFLIIFIGGCAFAHLKGKETIISPVFRLLGINNKTAIKLLDGTIDDNYFILRSEIDVPEFKSTSIEVDGICKLNDLEISPINTTMNKISNTKFIYYQVFDTKEMDLKDSETVNISFIVSEIKEYELTYNYNNIGTGLEDIVRDAYFYTEINAYNDGWNLEEKIKIKNLKDKKFFELTNTKDYTSAINGIKFSVPEFTTSSYGNIIKVKTDKTNFKGEKCNISYKILDENKNLISQYQEDNSNNEDQVYYTRLLLSNKKSKIYIEIINHDAFHEHIDIPVNLREAKEKTEKD